MSKIRVALFGYGHLGKWHAQKVSQLEESELSVIIEPFLENRERAKEVYPNTLVVSDWTEVKDKFDAAIVATPTSFHYQLVKELLEADKNIFCEKPLTETIEEAITLQSIEKGKSVVVQVGHSERFHKFWEEKVNYPEFFTKKSVVRINRVAPFKGRATDVDVVSDLMIHDFDLLHYLFEERPYKVMAWGDRIRTEKWDYVHVDLFYKSGRKATITASRNHVLEMRDLEITTEDGCLYFDMVQEKRLAFLKSDHEVNSKQFEKSDHLLEEQRYFYNSIINEKESFVGIEEGVDAVKMVSLVVESLETGLEVEI